MLQHVRHLHIAVLHSQVQWRIAPSVSACHACAMTEEQLHCLKLLHLHRHCHPHKLMESGG